MAEKETAGATIPVRVGMTGRKVHGPNSPDVIEGRVSLGHRDEAFTVGVPTIQEVDYDTAVSLFGQEKADELFRGVKEDENG